MNKKNNAMKSLLVAIYVFLSTNVSRAMDDINQDIETFRGNLLGRDASEPNFSDAYLTDDNFILTHCNIDKIKSDKLFLSKNFISRLIQFENYILAFSVPTILQESFTKIYLNTIIRRAYCNLPQNHIDEVIKGIKTYIREQSPLIFERLLSTAQYTKAYNFSVAYRDVFSTVDVENATLIQTDACNWLTQIQTKATTEIEEIANTIAALTGREILQKTYRLKGIKLINSFPEGDCIRIHLQARFDTIAKALLTEIPNEEEEIVRLKVVRKMADHLFPDEG